MSHTSPPVAAAGPVAALLVVSRFRVADVDRPTFLAAAELALTALTEQPGCVAGSLGQSTDEPGLLAIRTEWVGVGAYRRALSAFDVKINAIPLLSSAIDEPSAYEVVRHWDASGVTVAGSGLAADAGAVSLGQAAAAHVPPVSS